MSELKPQGAASIDEYLARLPEDRAEVLGLVRQVIHAEIPGLQETMAYGMPTFERGVDGPLIAMASQSAYLNLYLCDVDMASKFGDQIKAAGLPKCGKSCIRFTVKKQIPLPLLQAMLASRK